MDPKTVPVVFKNAVKNHGDKVALRKKELGLWHDITWNEYYRMATCVGSALRSMGLKKGDRVSIMGENCPEWVIIDLGIMCAGGVTVGLYSTNAWPQVEYIIENSGSTFFFLENEEQLDKWLHFRDKAPFLKKVIVWDLKGLRHFKDPMVMTYDELMELGEKTVEKDPELIEKDMADLTPDDTAMLIYTSGTTGPPKGAMLTHGNITWMGAAVQDAIEMRETDEILSFLPLCHVFQQLFSVFVHITHGFIVNFVESLDTVMDNMRETSPTVGIAVPRIWEKYLSAIYIRMSDATLLKRTAFNLSYRIGRKRTSLKLSSRPVPFYLNVLFHIAYFAVFRKLKARLGFDRMRVAISGGAPISPDVLSFFQSVGFNLIEGYGQTEGTAVTCVSREERLKFGTVGPPLTGVDVKIAPDGEILVRSPGVFKGYFNDPEATRDTLRDGWLCSGDIGELDEDGYLKITDRKKDIIITAGGKNIAPQYIENRLKYSPYINDAVIIGDNKKFISCLIMIDEDNVVKYAQDNKIQFSTYRDLTQNPDIRDLIQEEVARVNDGLSRVEQIKKFVILPKKLYEEDGEVTPTMKVKRAYVNEAFKDLIEAMYRKRSS